MNVTESFMLKQMQMLAGSINSLPQAGGSKNTGDSASFQDMIGKANEQLENSNGTEAGEKKPVEGKDPQSAGKDKPQTESKDEKEELKAENVTANPNAVVYTDLFRPEITPVVEETTAEPVLVEAPVEAEPEPEAAVELPVMETAEAVETVEVPEKAQTSLRQTLEEAPKQEDEAPVERPVQPAEAERTVETVEIKKEAPEVEVEVQTEDDSDEPKAEAAEPETPVFHDTKATPVKVGETYEAVDTQKPDMDEKLADTIQQAVQDGSQRLEIRLTPENLGALTIEMTKDASGALQVVLHASSSRAEGLLSQHMSGLHAALQNYSQEPVHIEVQRGEESQQQSLHQQTNPDGRGRQHQQRQEPRKEENHGDFLQKLRLGLFSETL